MTTAGAPIGDDLRCSTVTGQLGERAAGSAGGAERYVLVELPLPWPKKIDTHPLLQAPVTEHDEPAPESAPTSSVLGIRTSDDLHLGAHRIIVYDRTEPYAGFRRFECAAPTTSLAMTVAAALRPALGRLGSEHLPPEVTQVDTTSTAGSDDAPIDLLICTHGSRDRCCGQFGTRLLQDLEGRLPPEVRLWRTSHTGGHRFAPTGIVFPTGTAWAGLDLDLTQRVLTRSGATPDLEPHFRGNVGISGRPAQIAEGRAFLAAGWAWLDEPRHATVSSPSPEGDITVRVESASGRDDREVQLRPEDPVPVPVCGEPLDASVKSTPAFRVIGERRV